MNDIGHHLILKTNVRIGVDKDVSPFLRSSWGSWHLKLVDFSNEIHNHFYSSNLPRFEDVRSGERFGLIDLSWWYVYPMRSHTTHD